MGTDSAINKILPETPALRLIDWEGIGGSCKRAKVFGGWLVRNEEDAGGMAFVPDEDHEWDNDSV